MHVSRARLLYTLFAVAASGLLAASFAMMQSYSWQTTQLNDARSRWANRPFSHYRLSVEYGLSGYCQQVVDVEREHIITILQNTCKEDPPTVSDLFSRIERDLAIRNGQCGPNGCACDGRVVVAAKYDPRLGYPITKRLALNEQSRWLLPAYWEQQMRGDLCASRALIGETITVRALVPLS